MPNQSRIKELIHHCESGQWFYLRTGDYLATGTYGYEEEKDELSISPEDADCFVCRVCGDATAQMEEEFYRLHPNHA